MKRCLTASYLLLEERKENYTVYISEKGQFQQMQVHVASGINAIDCKGNKM